MYIEGDWTRRLFLKLHNQKALFHIYIPHFFLFLPAIFKDFFSTNLLHQEKIFCGKVAFLQQKIGASVNQQKTNDL